MARTLAARVTTDAGGSVPEPDGRALAFEYQEGRRPAATAAPAQAARPPATARLLLLGLRPKMSRFGTRVRRWWDEEDESDVERLRDDLVKHL